jgi:hypothetical protein
VWRGGDIDGREKRVGKAREKKRRGGGRSREKGMGEERGAE